MMESAVFQPRAEPAAAGVPPRARPTSGHRARHRLFSALTMRHPARWLCQPHGDVVVAGLQSELANTPAPLPCHDVQLNPAGMAETPDVVLGVCHLPFQEPQPLVIGPVTSSRANGVPAVAADMTRRTPSPRPPKVHCCRRALTTCGSVTPGDSRTSTRVAAADNSGGGDGGVVGSISSSKDAASPSPPAATHRRRSVTPPPSAADEQPATAAETPTVSPAAPPAPAAASTAAAVDQPTAGISADVLWRPTVQMVTACLDTIATLLVGRARSRFPSFHTGFEPELEEQYEMYYRAWADNQWSRSYLVGPLHAQRAAPLAALDRDTDDDPLRPAARSTVAAVSALSCILFSRNTLSDGSDGTRLAETYAILGALHALATLLMASGWIQHGKRPSFHYAMLIISGVATVVLVAFDAVRPMNERGLGREGLGKRIGGWARTVGTGTRSDAVHVKRIHVPVK